MKLKYLLLSLFSTIFFMGFAQEATKYCGQPMHTTSIWKNHPEIKQKQLALDTKLMEDKTPYVAKDNKVLIIPVVFHVLHEYGSEYISDAQIYDQMRILNEDFRKLNADTADIVPEFKAIAGDAKIEFRLATIDPFGNPTNGVTRHFTVESNIADAYSKLQQWPRNRYLNVWVCNSMEGNTAGYAHFPVSVEGDLRFMDGIMILDNHIGSIGTGSVYNSRSLTHEVGHYLNLYHTWGKTNGPNVNINCSDDDAVDDTPNTKGSPVSVCNLALATCSEPGLDNVQNFMDYSYCSVMFTNGQIKRMRNALMGKTAGRNNLWTQANLDVTIPKGVIYDPVADFFAERLVACVGESVQFENFSWRFSDTVGNNATYEWTFQDASTATSTQENPIVTFTSPGWKDVSLVITDNGRKNTITKNDFIWIAPNWTPHSGTVLLDFEDFIYPWVIQNPQKHPFQWRVEEGIGRDGSNAMFLRMTNPYENPTKFSAEYFYNQRRSETESVFITQPIDLSYVTGGTVTFDFACASDATDPAEMTESLIVYLSIDCGNSWVKKKEISGTDLVNNGSGWESFIPDEKATWSSEDFNISPVQSTNHVLLKFVYVGSDLSNNIAIDNIKIGGVLATEDISSNKYIEVYPNPTSSSTGWNISYDSNLWGGAEYQLTDIQGRIITSGVLPEFNNDKMIKPSGKASTGIYFIKIQNDNEMIRKKLILK